MDEVKELRRGGNRQDGRKMKNEFKKKRNNSGWGRKAERIENDDEEHD